MTQQDNYWSIVRNQFFKNRLGTFSLYFIIAFSLMGVYAPFLASSKPLFVLYDGTPYFPLFRYLFNPVFFTKRLDIFFNLLMFSLPLMVLFRKSRVMLVLLFTTHLGLFTYFSFGLFNDPASDPELNKAHFLAMKERIEGDSWEFDLQYMADYKKLNLLMQYRLRKEQDQRLQKYAPDYSVKAKELWLIREISKAKSKLLSEGIPFQDLPDNETLKSKILTEASKSEIQAATAIPSLWHVAQKHHEKELKAHNQYISEHFLNYAEAKQSLEAQESEISQAERTKAQRLIKYFENTQAEKNHLEDQLIWLAREHQKLDFMLMPLIRPFHWEDDAGGEQGLNRYIDWWELTRINRKDLVAALIFGIRISLVVGLMAVSLSLAIGVPIGSIAGYFGGKVDIIVFRLLEIWESMPTLYMLLLVVAVLQTKSIFLIILVIGLFSWTGFCRFIRGETLKQRHLPYVDACLSMGFSHRYIIFSHVLPNAIPPLLTLLPFSIMGAIGSEAGLSFLGLGEEGSCSWGVLMDEGRTAFPGESYLLWPPAILLTLLLVAIALVGDALRDAFDPKMRN
ncbi:hypothetical protein SCG7109_AZ_00070 [Chlamydiales bacterium SCGC AG-110-M15]|nr:hypothetical protein SCG7109_AZ_00070 [Chlamydiales bacterium SCGC AG-110-M15]